MCPTRVEVNNVIAPTAQQAAQSGGSQDVDVVSYGQGVTEKAGGLGFSTKGAFGVARQLGLMTPMAQVLDQPKDLGFSARPSPFRIDV